MAEKVRRLVPEAEVAVAHGQMPEDQLERVMLDFARGAIDVLVCTTIIESGLDIPNVNTIIINQADRLGLAQLYQLRGRVGRGASRAYAYLFYDRHRSLTEPAQKRLQAIFEATELGAGFQIALRDLEIRGAGNLLGAEQSGHIGAVGFDLYTRLLADAVEETKALQRGEKPPTPSDCPAAAGHRPAADRAHPGELRAGPQPPPRALPANDARATSAGSRRDGAGAARPLRAAAGAGEDAALRRATAGAGTRGGRAVNPDGGRADRAADDARPPPASGAAAASAAATARGLGRRRCG